MSTEATGRGYANRPRHSGKAKLLASVGVAAVLVALSAGSATAQVNWTGTTSNDWTVGSNWQSTVVPGAGTAINIGATSPNATVLGVGGAATGTTGNIAVGVVAGSTGNLTIQNGSTLTSTGLTARIGQTAGSHGTVTVTGSGSQWLVTGGQLVVGFAGTGTLNIENGAKVLASASSGTRLASGIGSGTINISGGGTLETRVLSGSGVGASQVNFDNAILRARGSAPITFIVGFAGTELNILAGGLTIDTVTFAVGTDATSAFTGVGGLTKIGTGTLNLAANNTYAGQTMIQAGTLRLTGAGDISNSSRVVADGTFDISTITAGGTSIKSLAGSGAVALGAKTLTITSANDVFSGVISGSGGLTLSGGTQTLSGANDYTGGTTISGGTLAISSDGALGAVAGALTFNGGALRALASFESTRAMSFTSDGVFDVTPGAVLTLSGALTGAGGLVKRGDGTLIQNAMASYSGPTKVEHGILQAGAAAVFGGDYSTLAGSTLDLGGFDQTIASINNAGALRLSGANTTLTVTGNYVGSGGTVYVNTALGDDSSATERLMVNGDSSGTSSLVVTNVGGTGAQTVQGIKVIEVGGASNGTFSLVGDYVFEGDQAVVGGAYAYRLYQGTESVADGDWYLRSKLIDAGPLYAPTVPLYENYANVLQSFNELGTLQQRVGSRKSLHGGQPARADNGAVAPDAIWARMDASQAQFAPDVSTTGASYEVTTWRLQAGMDGLLHESEAGALVAGVNGQFGTISSEISSIYGTGSIDAIGFGVGGTLTWYGASGLYVDGQAQLTRYEADIVSDTIGTTLVEGNDALGYGLSIEAGQKIGLDTNWSLTPQAQLAYSAVRFSDFTDRYNGKVSLSDGGDTLVGRLGLSADYDNEWKDATGETKRTHLYGVANFYYDLLDGSSVDVSGTAFTSRNRGLWGGVGIGGSLSWANERYSVFGEALARGSVADFGGNNALGAKLGFNVKW
ncbi:autotransporter outer membrane beta-barrel domain-containing protein [Aminobacter sp. UC22_36]|uniref:autotransporter family protein n=1 Tax=Aminobacter sp. UC22_36 TaxID=3374549 RepID=UPI003757C405